jgi:hypothetical protein
MATITQYVNVGGARGGMAEEFDSWTSFDYTEACDRAREYSLAVVAYEYEFSDSSLVADYRPEDDEFDERSRDASE